MAIREIKIGTILLSFGLTRDISGFEYSYGVDQGGKYESRADATKAFRAAGYEESQRTKFVGKAKLDTSGVIISFRTNPTTLRVDYPTTLIQNQFIGMDGGIVKPTQIGFVKVSGEGTLISDDTISATTAFNNLYQAQIRKEPFLMLGLEQVITGSHYFVIENLTVSVKSSPNTVDFNFSFIETKIGARSSTGFQYDTGRVRRNVAINPIKFRPTVSDVAAGVTPAGAANPAGTEKSSGTNLSAIVPDIKGSIANAFKSVASRTSQWAEAQVVLNKAGLPPF